MCASLVGKRADAEAYFKKFACGFWLRRAYIGQLEPIADAWATALARFDAPLAKRVRAAVPRPKQAPARGATIDL